MRGKSAQLCPFNELSCPSWTFQAEFCKWSQYSHFQSIFLFHYHIRNNKRILEGLQTACPRCKNKLGVIFKMLLITSWKVFKHTNYSLGKNVYRKTTFQCFFSLVAKKNTFREIYLKAVLLEINPPGLCKFVY